MRVVRGGHFWQFSSETTDGEILQQLFWAKYGLRSDLRVPNSVMNARVVLPKTKTKMYFSKAYLLLVIKLKKPGGFPKQTKTNTKFKHTVVN